jgi:hypothetical protein
MTTSIEIRVLSPAGIEDYHAHLLRLDIADRRLRFAGESDDRGIDGHCLRLLGTQAIVIGGYVDGTLRAGVEICPDRTARHADATFTAEPKFALAGVTRMLLTRMIDEARRYHLCDMRLHGLDIIGELERAAQPGGIEVMAGDPVILRFAQATAMPIAAGAPAIAAYA